MSEKVKKGKVEKAEAGASVPDAPEKFTLSREEVKAAGKFTREEALALIGMYYALQKVRVAQSNRISAHERGDDTMAVSEPAPTDELPIVKRLKDETLRIEIQCQRALREFAKASVVGQWAMTQYGVGPVIAAGLLAHINWNTCRWASQIYSFAGINPNAKEWEKGQKRPHNAALKKLLWNLGECFKRVSGKPEAFYGQFYAQRKKLEIANNESGKLAERAKSMLDKANKNKWRITKEMRACWESGKLQPCGLDLRAMRYAVKMFLSHFHQIGRAVHFGETVKPWVLVHGGHGDYIPPPNWPMKDEKKAG